MTHFVECLIFMLSLLPEMYYPGPGLSVFEGLRCSLLLKPSPGLSPKTYLGAILRGRAKYAEGPYRYKLPTWRLPVLELSGRNVDAHAVLGSVVDLRAVREKPT